jgi:UDP-glucose 4-epimerase
MTRVLVTGGAGFIGSNLVERLLSDNSYTVTIVDDFSTGRKRNLKKFECEVIESDISDLSSIFFSKLNTYDVIVHLAARGSVPRSVSDPVTTTKVNVLGTQNLLEYARTGSSRFLFASSSSIYGSNTRIPKKEHDWARPTSPYGASKLAGEALVSAYSTSYGIPTLALRFFNVFGPNQFPDSDFAAVVPKWIWRAMEGDLLTVYGDGSTLRDFTYVGSVIDVIISAIENDLFSNSFVNLAFGTPISLNELLEEIKEWFPELKWEYVTQRVGDIRESQNDPKYLHELFPSIIPITFKEGIISTIRWLQELKDEQKMIR